ncbi:hypothetical protein HG531_005574 [Fusarium graminearum]|nr:hypothetical protein HG531_005574 [Fusarium graminearum]
MPGAFCGGHNARHAFFILSEQIGKEPVGSQCRDISLYVLDPMIEIVVPLQDGQDIKDGVIKGDAKKCLTIRRPCQISLEHEWRRVALGGTILETLLRILLGLNIDLVDELCKESGTRGKDSVERDTVRVREHNGSQHRPRNQCLFEGAQNLMLRNVADAKDHAVVDVFDFRWGEASACYSTFGVAECVLVCVLAGGSGGWIGFGYFRSDYKTRLLEFSREEEMGLLLDGVVLDQVLQVESLAAGTQHAVAIA